MALKLVSLTWDSTNPARLARFWAAALEWQLADDQRATVARFIDLGAREIDIGQGPDAHHVVMADPDGNAFCVLEPGNNFASHTSRFGSITCDGTRDVGLFGSKALGWPLVWDRNEETAIKDPDGGGQLVTWGGPPIPEKLGKNRLHLDVAPAA